MNANQNSKFFNILNSSFTSKLQRNFTLVIILILTLSNSFAQQSSPKYTSLGEIYNSGSVKVELLVEMSKTPCAQMNTDNTYQLRMTGIKNAYAGRGYFLNWKMRLIKCNGDILLKNISISLDNTNKEGLNDNMDWYFEGTHVETPIVAEISRNPNTEKDRIIRDVKSIAPDYIIGDSVLMTGQSTKLRLVGGLLGTNAKWAWFESCGGKFIDEGPSIIVVPKSNTTYSVRAISPNDSTSCVFKTIEIDNESRLTPQAKIIGPTKICPNDSKEIQLEATGGRKGLKADWVWYRDSCGSKGSFIRKGDRMIEAIKKTTTYYARLEGETGITACISHMVIVSDNSIKPQEITGKNEVCENTNFTLRIKGGTLANDPAARWVWANSPDFKTKIGFGDSLSVSKATQNATYYLRAEGSCNTTQSVNKTVSIKSNSVMPDGISVLRNPKGKKLTNKYNLEIKGGSLGSGSQWYWYRKIGSVESLIQSGTETVYKDFNASPGKNLISVIARGECNQTDPIEKEFDNFKPNTANTQFGFLNIGIINQDFSNLIFTVGTKDLYFRYKNTSSQKGNSGKIVSSYECTESGLVNFPINNVRYFEFTGNQFVTRTSYTGGFIIGLTKEFKKNEDLKFKPNARLYVGGGHGSIKPMWETRIVQYANGQSETKWALNTQYQVEGIEAEMGLFIRIRYFNLMAGMNVIMGKSSKKYINSTVGLGISIY